MPTTRTPLMAAAGLGTANPLEEAGTEAEALEAVKVLLDLGADVNAVDKNGDTAMHGAAYGNFPTIVQLLADRGADVNIWKRPDNEGRTPLFIAEGYKAGRPQPSRPTIDAIQRLMVAAGVPTDGTRPRILRYLRKGARASRKGSETLGSRASFTAHQHRRSTVRKIVRTVASQSRPRRDVSMERRLPPWRDRKHGAQCRNGRPEYQNRDIAVRPSV